MNKNNISGIEAERDKIFIKSSYIILKLGKCKLTNLIINKLNLSKFKVKYYKNGNFRIYDIFSVHSHLIRIFEGKELVFEGNGICSNCVMTYKPSNGLTNFILDSLDLSDNRSLKADESNINILYNIK